MLRHAVGRLIPPIAAVALAAACGGSGGSTSTPPCTVSGVTVGANPAAMNAGATSALTATVNASASCTGGVTWSATPTGGTLSPSGLIATFTTTTAGTYTITATSTADATKSGSATVTVTSASPACGQPNGTITTHAANITANETWAGDGVVHRIPNSIALSGSAVVTIQPCAIVALAQGATISVGGTSRLVSAGTGASRFVTFRRDVATQAWGTLRGISATSLIDLTWTTLTGGGNFGAMSDPTIAGFGNGYSSPIAPVIQVNNVTIQGSQGVGVYLDANAAFTSTSQQLTITGSGGRPINTQMMALGTLPSGAYTGNTTDEILITGPSANVFGDLTVEDRGVPVRIPYGGMSIASVGGATAPVTLTLKPGVVFKFPRLGSPPAPGMRMIFGTNGNPPNNLVGILNAVGTALKPIVFTSGEATPVAGDWVGIWLNTANGSRLDFVEISYAGAPSGIVSNNCRINNTPDNAALFVGDFSPQ